MPDANAREAAIAELVASAECASGCPKGWQPYVIIASALLDAAYPGWKLAQVKEKFGGLRFYIEPAPFRDPTEDEAAAIKNEPDSWKAKDYERWRREWYAGQEAIATAAERACEGKCEVCGDPGERTTGGWIHTLCGIHRKRYEDGQPVYKQAADEEVLADA